MSENILLIRADASAEIGAGHVMRCIALAQAWQRAGGRTTFALAAGGELEGRIRSEGAEVVKIHAVPGSRDDADQTSAACQRLRAEWTAVDGYHFSADYRRTLRAAPTRLLLFDDNAGDEGCACDVALNPDPDATLGNSRRDSTVYLRGPQYALLRREFLECGRPHSDIPESARRILVTLGGGDSHNVAQQVFEALEELRDLTLEVTVVVGASYPFSESLQAAVANSRHSSRFMKNVENMPELISDADLAITAGGGTSYELAFMQVPMFLITMAKNHERAVQSLASSGAAIDAGWFSSLDRTKLATALRRVICDRELRVRLASNAARVVDGKGASRVVETMLAISRPAVKKVF